VTGVSCHRRVRCRVSPRRAFRAGNIEVHTCVCICSCTRYYLQWKPIDRFPLQIMQHLIIVDSWVISSLCVIDLSNSKVSNIYNIVISTGLVEMSVIGLNKLLHDGHVTTKFTCKETLLCPPTRRRFYFLTKVCHKKQDDPNCRYHLLHLEVVAYFGDLMLTSICMVKPPFFIRTTFSLGDTSILRTVRLFVRTDLLRGQVVALGDLLVQLADVAEVRYQSCGTAMSQLTVEDQWGRLRLPVRWLRHLLFQRRSAGSNPGTVIPRDIVVVGLMMVAILHTICGFLRCRQSWRSPRLEQRHPRFWHE
jgi:hypothetical protein